MNLRRHHRPQRHQPAPHLQDAVSCIDTLSLSPSLATAKVLTTRTSEPPRSSCERAWPPLDLLSPAERQACFAQVQRHYQHVASRLDQILSYAPARRQLEIDGLLSELTALAHRSDHGPAVKKVFDGSSEIVTTCGAWRGIKAEVHRLSGEASHPGYPLFVHIAERATPAEIFLFKSALSMAAADLRLSLPYSAKIRLRGNLGVADIDVPAGSSVEHIAHRVNQYSLRTGATATVVHGSLALNSLTRGSQASLGFWHLDAALPHDLNLHVSGNQAYGTDAEASVNAQPGYGQGENLICQTPAFEIELRWGSEAPDRCEFAAATGGIVCQGAEQVHRIGLPSLALSQLGCNAGRLFEVASGQSKNLLAHPALASMICRNTADRLRAACERLDAYHRAWQPTVASATIPPATIIEDTIGNPIEELEPLAVTPRAGQRAQPAGVPTAGPRCLDAPSEFEVSATQPILVQMGTSLLAVPTG